MSPNPPVGHDDASQALAEAYDLLLAIARRKREAETLAETEPEAAESTTT